MTTSTPETLPTAPRGTRTSSGVDKPTTRLRCPRTNGGEEASSCERHFPAKETGDGSTRALGREVASQSKGLVQALRSGVTYYVILEFRVIPDFAVRRPQLQKEAVRGK